MIIFCQIYRNSAFYLCLIQVNFLVNTLLMVTSILMQTSGKTTKMFPFYNVQKLQKVIGSSFIIKWIFYFCFRQIINILMYTNTFTNQQITASILPRLQRNLCCEFINQTIPEILTLAYNIKSTATSCS